MTATAIQIFTNQAGNGTSVEFGTNGQTHIRIKGTFDTATIDLESKSNNTNDSFSSVGGDFLPIITELEFTI